LEFGAGSGKFHIGNIFVGGLEVNSYRSIWGMVQSLAQELFCVADEPFPSVVFIDEIDAVGTKR
jgi:ATP-dependent 26S proteasome regulatory subunit